MILRINNDLMPSPSKLYVVLSDIKTEERNAAGAVVVDLVATGKRRIECDWSYIDRHNLKYLLSATSETFFDVAYFDPLDDDIREITCSVGERSIGALIYKDNIPVWGVVKMTFTER